MIGGLKLIIYINIYIKYSLFYTFYKDPKGDYEALESRRFTIKNIAIWSLRVFAQAIGH